MLPNRARLALRSRERVMRDVSGLPPVIKLYIKSRFTRSNFLFTVSSTGCSQPQYAILYFQPIVLVDMSER